MEELQELRQEIDRIDAQIVALFEARMAVTQKVGEYKVKRGLPVLDAGREKEVLAKKTALLKDPDRAEDVTVLYECIMGISRRQQRALVKEGAEDPSLTGYYEALKRQREPLARPRVLYQGEPGAYAEEAAARFFGEETERRRVRTWEDIFLALRAGEADYGVIPIENNSTGSINAAYDLLAQYQAFIVGEQTVRVDHCLMAPAGATLDTIRTVRSHEQGLIQCEEFLRDRDWQQVPMLNTAAAAKYVAERGDVTQAAIGSPRAARLYGLTVLAEKINFNSENFTRFVVVSPVLERREGGDKISATFTIPHESGSLHRIMTVFAVHGINLLKLESRPIVGKSWEYRFFIDLEGSLADERMDGVIHEMAQLAAEFRILGNYRKSEG